MSGPALTERPVSRETRARLETYADLLRKWSPRINLVSRATLSQLWERHFADSAQLFELAGVSRGRWVDLGSGGGFPGAVVAILAAEVAPELSVTLIESDGRKAAFLRSVSRETGVPFTTLDQRIEEAPPQAADVLSARALAPLTVLLGHAQRHLAPDGIALFPKGARHETELAEARRDWRFAVEQLPSRTEPAAAIYRIGRVARA